jgi:hypothetical protein
MDGGDWAAGFSPLLQPVEAAAAAPAAGKLAGDEGRGGSGGLRVTGMAGAVHGEMARGGANRLRRGIKRSREQ